MSSKLKLQVVLEAMDKVSAPLQRMNKRIGKSAKELADMRKKLQSVNDAAKNIDAFGIQQGKVAKMRKSLSEARNEQRRLLDVIKKTPKPTRAMKKAFDNSRAAVKKHEQANTKAMKRLAALGNELKQAVIDTRQLSAEKNRLTAQIEKQTNAIERQKKSLGKLNQKKKRHEKLKNFTEKGKMLGTKAALVGVAGGYAFGRVASGFIETAAEFERYEAILKTTEGTSEKAKKAMGWVTEFATKTPYDVAQVTDSFVKLRSYGLDPTSGLMQTLGDTSAAMGTPIMQAVEAIADAVTGENERLKGFGITASTKKDTITYSYTDKNGEQKLVKVNKKNRQAIEKALTDIWNEKFAGAMINQSQAWIGMMSNLRDHWQNFQRSVMEAGAMDYLKNKLHAILKKLKTWSDNGKLQEWAQKVSDWFIRASENLWSFGESVIDTVNWVKDLTAPIGGLGNALKVLLGLYVSGKAIQFISFLNMFKNAQGAKGIESMTTKMFGLSKVLGGKFVGSVARAVVQLRSFALTLALTGGMRTAQAVQSMGVFAGKAKILGSALGTKLAKGAKVALLAMRGLAVFMVTNPIGLAIMGIATAAYYIYKYWKPIKRFFLSMFDGVSNYFSDTWKLLQTDTVAGLKKIGGDAIGAILDWSPLGTIYKVFKDPLSEYFGVEMPATLSGLLGKGWNMLADAISQWDPLGAMKGAMKGALQWFNDKMKGLSETWQSFINFLGMGDDANVSQQKIQHLNSNVSVGGSIRDGVLPKKIKNAATAVPKHISNGYTAYQAQRNTAKIKKIEPAKTTINNDNKRTVHQTINQTIHQNISTSNPQGAITKSVQTATANAAKQGGSAALADRAIAF